MKKTTIILAVLTLLSLAAFAQKDSLKTYWGSGPKTLNAHMVPSGIPVDTTCYQMNSGVGKQLLISVKAKPYSDTLVIETVGVLAFKDFNISVDSLRRLVKKKSDTTFVPVPLYERTDTIMVNFLYGTSRLKKCDGYMLARGFKYQRGQELVWVNQPSIIGFLDEKRRPISDVMVKTVDARNAAPVQK